MTDSITLLQEAFIARLLPMFKETTLTALRHFAPEKYPDAVWFAAAGALLASLLLYFIGVWLRRLPEKVSTEAQRARIEKMRVVAHEWLPWLLILSATPFGGVLIMAAGFFALRPFVAAAAIVAAEVLWRIAPLL